MRPAALLLAVLLWAVPAAAQEGAPDYSEWEALALRTEEALQDGTADDEALEALRGEIVAAREEFLAAQDAGAVRIATLESQIAALGPAPGEGEEEPADTASRRAELQDRLARLRAPGRTAEEAFLRASGLVAEIDGTLRQRQTRALLEMGPSPLDPSRWTRAVRALGNGLDAFGQEARDARASPELRQNAWRRLAAATALFVVGLALILRARGWVAPLMRAAEARLPPRAQGAAVFALSAGQIVVPVVGAVLAAAALDVLGLDGPLFTALGAGLVLAAVQYFGARWIGSWLFPVGERWNLTLGLPDRARAEGRAYTALLGTILALGTVLALVADAREWGAGTVAVVAFPLQVAIGAMLVRLGQLLARHAGQAGAPQDGEPGAESAADGYAGPLLRNVGRASMAVGVLGPVAAAAGYGALAQAVLGPAVMSLALIGLLVIVQQVIRDLYALAAGRDDGARDALLPVLLGFGVAVCSLPVFALVWGARVSDITEVWARIRAGFRVGETVISPGAILSFALILAIGILLTRLIQGALRTQVLPRTRIDTGGRTAIVSGLGYVGFIVAALVAITGAGIDLSTLAVVAGALSVGIGFGLQNVVNNFVSGIILLVERPISEGDWIEVGGQMGYVRSISVRSTRIETFDRTDVIVPNADLISGTVTNWTRGNLIGRLIVAVGVAYGTDTRLVERVLREIAEAHPMVLLKPPPSIFFRRFGADAMEFEIRAILRDVNWVMHVETDMNHEIARRFAEEGIEIPFPQRDMWLRNPEALRARTVPEAPAGEVRAEGQGEVVSPSFVRRGDAARGEGTGGRP